MLIKDIDRKLDMMCIIAIMQDSPWFILSSRFGTMIPGYLYQEEGKNFLQMYVQRNLLPRGLQTAILSHKTVVQKKTHYVITEAISNEKQMAMVTDLMQIPSVMTTNSYLMGDELFISFRFHSNFTEEVNVALSRINASSGSVRIAFLGPSPGITAVVDRVNSETPVSVVRYSVPLPEDNRIVELALNRDREGLAELDPRKQNINIARLILYSNTRIDDALKPISHDDHVYESDIEDKFMVEGARLGNELRIPRIAFFIRLRGNRLEDTTFIPTVEADEYINVFFSVKPDTGRGKPVLELYSSLEQDMWNWL